MNNILKRFITSLLIICLMSNIVVFSTDSTSSYSSTDTHMIEVLKAVSVLDDGDITEGDEPVTRAKAAHFAASLVGISKLGVEVTDKYSDVNKKTKYVDDIMTLTKIGVLNGYGDGTFKPNSDISVAEAVKIILSAVGYTAPAESGGGYLSGYLSYATHTGLLKGISFADGESLRFSTAVKLLYNALSVEVMISSTISPGGGSVASYDGKTVLTELLRVNKGRGVVTATSFCSITTEAACDTGHVVIDGVTYKTGEQNLDDMLGCRVEYYYKEDDSESNVILYAFVLDSVKTLTISDEDLDSFTGSEFLYYEGTKRLGAKVTKFTDIVYNHLPLTNIGSDFNISNGIIKLIDNNADGVYDVVFIEEYRNVYVESVNYSEGIIYDRFNPKQPLVFNLNDVGKKVILYDRKGYQIGIDGIENDSVLSCLISRDGKRMILYVVVNEIVGTVNGITKSEDEEYVTIEDSTYSIAPEFKAQKFQWPLGEKIICYLDKNNKLVAVSDLETTTYRWAVFENCHVASGVSKDVSIRVFEEGGESGVFSNYNVANRINIDETPYTKTDIAKLSIENSRTIFGGTRNIIMYSLNANGEINNIRTEKGNGFYKVSDFQSYLVDSKSRVLGGKIGYTDGTKVFVVPGENLGEEEYSFGKVADTFAHSASYNLKVYKKNADVLNADIIITQSADKSAALTKNSPVLLIDKITTSINEDGELVKKIYGYRSTSYLNFQATDSDVFEKMTALGATGSATYSVKRGDLIRYAVDLKGRIKTAQLVYRGSENKIFSSSNPNESWYFAETRIAIGSIYQKDGDAFKFSTSTNLASADVNSMELFKLMASTSVYVYDRKDDEIYRGTMADVLDYKSVGSSCSQVAVYSSGGEIRCLIILK